VKISEPITRKLEWAPWLEAPAFKTNNPKRVILRDSDKKDWKF
jgi:hypothetical protein